MLIQKIDIPVVYTDDMLDTFGRSWLGFRCTVKGFSYRVVGFKRGKNRTGVWLYFLNGSRIYKPYREAIKK